MAEPSRLGRSDGVAVWGPSGWNQNGKSMASCSSNKSSRGPADIMRERYRVMGEHATSGLPDALPRVVVRTMMPNPQVGDDRLTPSWVLPIRTPTQLETMRSLKLDRVFSFDVIYLPTCRHLIRVLELCVTELLSKSIIDSTHSHFPNSVDISSPYAPYPPVSKLNTARSANNLLSGARYHLMIVQQNRVHTWCRTRPTAGHAGLTRAP